MGCVNLHERLDDGAGQTRSSPLGSGVAAKVVDCFVDDRDGHALRVSNVLDTSMITLPLDSWSLDRKIEYYAKKGVSVFTIGR